jgi:hypothetical protein
MFLEKAFLFQRVKSFAVFLGIPWKAAESLRKHAAASGFQQAFPQIWWIVVARHRAATKMAASMP